MRRGGLTREYRLLRRLEMDSINVRFISTQRSIVFVTSRINNL